MSLSQAPLGRPHHEMLEPVHSIQGSRRRVFNIASDFQFEPVVSHGEAYAPRGLSSPGLDKGTDKQETQPQEHVGASGSQAHCKDRCLDVAR